MVLIRSRKAWEVRRLAGGVIPWLGVAIVGLAYPAWGGEDMLPRNAAEVEYFEKTIRPILVTRCLSCHDAAKHKGGLRLDRRSGVLAGGASGPVIVPGKPEESLLVDAINYGESYQMPPRSRLPAGEVAALTDWVRRGARWGLEKQGDSTPSAAGESLSAEEYRSRSQFWSFQPLADPTPPVVRRDSWLRNPIDAFVLHELEERGLEPSPEADRRVLARRLSFDLLGLPPDPAEVAAFLADPAADAYEKLVDRLLASPHYGERQARRWLDLMRYAESSGHEFDYAIQGAYRYRDYVIRSMNVDLPFDQFVIEHLAGDLLSEPRRRPGRGTNESILGTGYLFLGEGTHSPVDVREEQMRRIENQLDVTSKAFLGLTLACARCHDHKFDPITTRDYYAFAGFMRSTRMQRAVIDPPEARKAALERLRVCKGRVLEVVRSSRELLPVKDRLVLDAVFAAEVSRRVALTPGVVVFDDFSKPTLDGWYGDGDAFGADSTRPGDVRIEWRGATPWLVAVRPGQAHSGLLADELAGVIRSASFPIRSRYLNLRLQGRGGRVSVVIDNFEKIRDPIYGGLTRRIDHGGRDENVVFDLGMWQGHMAYLEIADGAVADFGGAEAVLDDPRGWIAVDEIQFSDHPGLDGPPPSAPTELDLGNLRTELDCAAPAVAQALDQALAQLRQARAELAAPTLALAAADGTPLDEHLHIRGNHHNLGERVPRRFLQILGSVGGSSAHSSQTRLDLAHQMVDPQTDPLLPRVIVNRLWHDHFGEGIVRSVDDFGGMGERPSHPALLDWLARELVTSGWSLKSIHRLMVVSSTYRMTSRHAQRSEELDPGDIYLHRMRLRRLEAEPLRDAVLAVSGRLDRRMEGPSVPTHLTAFMDGRGRPARSGPLDGNGRRTIYLAVNRNFLNPLLLAFDMPAPFATMGRRNQSNVPAQALALCNDPFIKQQAELWARRLLAQPAASDRERLDRLYQAAFARPAAGSEVALVLGFLAQERNAAPAKDELAIWTQLCLVLINTKEFLFIE